MCTYTIRVKKIGGVKYWQMYAYQTFDDNKLVNHLSSTFQGKFWLGKILANCQIH